MHVTLRVNSEALTWHCLSELAWVKWSQSAVGPAPRGKSWEADCPDQMLAASVLPLADSWLQTTASLFESSLRAEPQYQFASNTKAGWW